jgi:hypothetical protein
MQTKFWLKSLKRRDHIKDLCMDRKIILGKYGRGVWTGLIWLSGGFL